jgi:hypothetical protein
VVRHQPVTRAAYSAAASSQVKVACVDDVEFAVRQPLVQESGVGRGHRRIAGAAEREVLA